MSVPPNPHQERMQREWERNLIERLNELTGLTDYEDHFRAQVRHRHAKGQELSETDLRQIETILGKIRRPQHRP